MSEDKRIKQLKKKFSKGVLEATRFSRSKEPCLYIERSSLLEIAQDLYQEFGLDFLENLVAMQVEEALVLTYFLQSAGADSPESVKTLVLRVSLEMGKGKKASNPLKIASVTQIWPMAEFFEAEICDLFGVEFEGAEDHVSMLPKEVKGYPLRKGVI